MPIVVQGGTVTLSAESRNGSGVLQDATNVTLTVKTTGGVTLAGFPVIEPTIDYLSLGQYEYVWTVPLLTPVGTYFATWESILNGGPQIGIDQIEVVLPGSLDTSPLVFMQAPDDYETVRSLLGVTTLDLEDEQIELPTFAPAAEYEVKRRISNWATQVLDTDLKYVLRLAVVYKTACYLAESYVRGGTIGMVRPLSTGEGRDWADAATMFCSRYEYWVQIADQSDDDSPTDSDYSIRPFVRSGPTSMRIARRNSGSTAPVDMSWFRWPPYWGNG